MRLASLEITGFKSFAKHVRLEFEEGNTAIVGPNGSGKSNISDAIRWVLGEQSMKTLRGKKLEDVIYSGGVTKGRLGMAEVSLTLDSAGEGPLDVPEIMITRRLYRSGESDYLVNNRQVRLLDIHEILAKAGFAQKTYTVIGQGMADSFVNASAVERRAMFEDATGVTPLLIKKEQAERKLEQTKENLTRAKDHLSELEPRLRSLRRQATRARQREEVETVLKQKEESWFSHLWISYSKTIEEADKKLALLNEHIQKTSEKIRSMASQEEGNSSTNLPQLKQELEKLRQEEQDIAINLAQQGYSTEDIIDRRSEEKVAREKERQRLGYLLNEVQEARREQEEILRKTREALRKLQDILLAQNGKTDGVQISKVKEQINEVAIVQDQLIERLNNVESIDELAALQEDAEKVRLLLQELSSSLEVRGTTEQGQDIQAQVAEIMQEREAIERKIADQRVTEARLEVQLKVVDDRLLELSTISAERKDNGSGAKRLEEVRAQRVALGKEVESLEKVLFASHEERRRRNMVLEKEREDLHNSEQEKYRIEVEVAGTRARKEDVEREITQRLGAELLGKLRSGEHMIVLMEDLAVFEQDIYQLRKKLELIGGIDPNVIKEEAEVETRVVELSTQIKDLEQASSDLREGIKELDKHVHLQFNSGMKAINENFNNYFRQVFGGGKASLAVIKPQPIVHETPADPATVEASDDLGVELEELDQHVHELPAGVEIKANPPGKKLGSISQLSGGEKALTSVALLFAIISWRNAPFIVFDEVDAALDEANSRRFAAMLKELSKKTQFIVITHNRSTMESANSLYGVTMSEEGVSQLLSVKLADVPQEYVASK